MNTEPVPPHSAEPSGTEAAPGRYSVPEIARLLGISERAVRKRITAGTLQAHKEQGAWSVLLPATMGAVPMAPSEPAAVLEGGTSAELGRYRDPELHEAIVQLRTLLTEERQRADRYLEASTLWQSRALQLEERLKMLEAGPSAVDVPQERDAGPPRGDVVIEASDAMKPASDSLARSWRRWWRRVMGG